MADEQPSQSSQRTIAAPATRSGPGFFTIYKKGQGYWTRMGTALAAVVIAALVGHFAYDHIRVIQTGHTAQNDPVYLGKGIAGLIGAGLGLAMMLFGWRLMNKPGNVDFLIATDSEMKKVNWTTRKELIGSTKVVIFFVILIALVLFVLDVVFGELFYHITVLEIQPLEGMPMPVVVAMWIAVAAVIFFSVMAVLRGRSQRQ